MRYPLHPPPLETHVQAAWQAQLDAAGQMPARRADLVRRCHELFPRFSVHYTRLQALPRRVRRALQRQFGLPLATLALWLALGLLPVQAATIPVGGTCTLVDALTAANTDAAAGGCPAGSGADMIVLPAASLQTLSSVHNDTYGPTGLPVVSSVITIAGQGSTITRANEAPEFRLFALNRTGDLTLQETTISGGRLPGTFPGGGVFNDGTLTVTDSTIAGNYAGGDGGGVFNGGTLTVTDSTITGNTIQPGARIGSGGGVANYGTLTVTNSTITGNSGRIVGGGVANRGTVTVADSTITGNSAGSGGGMHNGYGYPGPATVTLARTLVSGNTAAYGPEIFNAGTVVADNHNLFGLDGDAGGFEPGATDLVPSAGVQLPDILDPTLALHGGRTQTHALVPGSLAIDTGGPVCLDADGEPLRTDQRGRPRPVDGDGDSTAACDIGAFEFLPAVNDFVTLDPDLDTGFDPTPVREGPAGTFTITATFTNTSDTPLRFRCFEVTALSGGNRLLNADEEPGGVGATLTPEVGDDGLAPGEAVTADFVIGLQVRAPFTFVVELFGEPVPPAAGEPSRPLTGDAAAMAPRGRRSSEAPTASSPARPRPFRFAFDPTAVGERGR